MSIGVPRLLSPGVIIPVRDLAAHCRRSSAASDFNPAVTSSGKRELSSSIDGNTPAMVLTTFGRPSPLPTRFLEDLRYRFPENQAGPS